MKVLAVERGDRPSVMTRARVLAPQGVKFLSSLLEDEAFADKAGIVLDWRGDLAWNGEGEMPEDLRVPVLWVECSKWYPQYGQTLRVDYKLDIEDFFGQDNATSADLYEVVENLKTKVREEEARRSK